MAANMSGNAGHTGAMHAGTVSHRQRWHRRGGALGAAFAIAVVGVLPPVEPAAATLVPDPAGLVNPMIGTRNPPSGGGNTAPGPVMPFGMVQWGPDTYPRTPGGGYDYDATAISGF